MQATILQDRGEYDTLENTQEAIDLAEMLFHGAVAGAPDIETTFSVENKIGEVIASFTNRRILADIECQQWGGRKGDDAIHVKDETLDVTDYVLAMPYERFIEIQDSSTSSDDIGRAHLDWPGPCDVEVAESIAEFFGAASLREVTRVAFEAGRAAHNPQPPVMRTVILTVEVSLAVRPDIDLGTIADDLELGIQSNVPGIVVRGQTVRLAGAPA